MRRKAWLNEPESGVGRFPMREVVDGVAPSAVALTRLSQAARSSESDT